MVYTLDNGKNVTISDEEISRYMSSLDITKNEAIVMWLEDNDYQENEEQQKLCQKAKENRITATIHQARKSTTRKSAPPKKEDEDKQALIRMLVENIKGVEELSVTNKQKIIEFKYNSKWYKLDLICSRNKNKKGE